MNVLITGSSGQIGTNLALRLLRDGYGVLGVDNRANTWTREFPYLLHDLTRRFCPTPTKSVPATISKLDVVVHLAAHAKVYQLVRQPERALENVVMTYNVLEFCRARKVPIIYASSREVYGDIHRFVTNETSADFAYTESTYSASKIAGEAFVYSFARCYGVNYLAFRFSNVYGRYDNDLQRMVRVIPLFIHSMSRGDPITIFGAEKILDFTYVDDCVDGIMRGIVALCQRRITNETINLAYGEGNTLVRVAELIAAELGARPSISLQPPLVGEVTRYVADIARARELLGWQPAVPLAEGIRRGVAWFLEHRAKHPDEDVPVAPQEHNGALFKPTA